MAIAYAVNGIGLLVLLTLLWYMKWDEVECENQCHIILCYAFGAGLSALGFRLTGIVTESAVNAGEVIVY